MRSKRIEEIKNYIYENRTVALDQICGNFDEILRETDIKKIYGGVTTLPREESTPFEERNISNSKAKEQIAAAAAKMVEDGDIIFIDSGTTTLNMIEFIKNKKDITIFTNNVGIILRAIPYDNITIISLSGTLIRRTLSFTGTSSAQVLQNYNISKAFMASTGFSIANGVTNSFPLESDIKRTTVQRSRRVYLLADSSKCDVVSLITYCDLDKVNFLITEANPSKEICNYIMQYGNKILLTK